MTNPTPTDWRALCAVLTDDLEEWVNGYLINDPADQHTDASFELIDRVRAALAQPEPQGPTDEELVELFNENDWNFISPETFIDIARSVLELQ
jgi:hypothetical protein